MRLPTDIVDKLAVETPHGIWVKIPKENSVDGDLSWQDVTWSQLRQAVSTMAHWIDVNLGPRPGTTAPKEWPVITYMGINDIRYPIFMLAAMKTRYVSFLTSPRNSQQAHLSLLRETNSETFVYTPEFASTVSSLSESIPSLITIQIPPLDFFLNPKRPKQFTSQTAEIPNNQTLLIVHSGGTTSPLGIPTPISLKAGIFPIIESLTSMHCPAGRTNVADDLYGTDLMLTALPAFHIMGINLLLGRSIYHRKPLVLLPADRPPTTEMVLQGIEKTGATSVMLAPSMIADIWRDDRGKGGEMLSRLESIHYGGASLDRGVGDEISKVSRLINGIGSTETFSLASYVPVDVADWEYFEWNLDGTGIVMEPYAEQNNLYELVIKRQEDPDKAKWQFVFQNLPNLQEWRMGDLYEPHPDPDKRGRLWRSVGRKDDILVFSNGEKVNPTGFETLVGGCPLVTGVILVGTGRFQTGVVVELVENTEKEAAALDEIWKWIEKGNAELPSHAKVWRSMVTFAVPDKPFVRSGKGVVVRRATVALYEREIGMLYGKRERDDADSEEENMGEQNNNIDGVLESVRDAVCSVLGNPKVSDEGNLFQLGLDSLQALELSRALTRRFRHLQGSMSPLTRIVYENPTIMALSKAIHAGTSTSQTMRKSKGNISREERMSRMIHKYTIFLGQAAGKGRNVGRTLKGPDKSSPVAAVTEEPIKGYKVLLTGSTGSLGTHLLHSLLQEPLVSHIYCLNRSPDAAKRQTESFRERHLKIPLSSNKVERSGEGYPAPEQSPPQDKPKSTGTVVPELTLGDYPNISFLTSPDLGQTYLGLDKDVYNDLANDGICLIIHNAWPVNFNSPLEAFEPALAGVSRLVDFIGDLTASTSTLPHMVFVSSVASVMNYPAVRKNIDHCSSKGYQGNRAVVKIPEEFDPDNSLPVKQGYGESKHVASCILGKAINGNSDMRATIIRVGQLAGSTDGKGVWGRHEWFPSLVETSRNMGKLPTSLGNDQDDAVDWLPVDIAARSILELALSRLHRVGSTREPRPALATFNLVNPYRANWQDIMATVKEYYSSREGIQIKDVPYKEWLTELTEISNYASAQSSSSSRKMTDIARKYPAVKLLDFFQEMLGHENGVVRFSTDEAVASSKTLAEARPVDREMMGRWLAGWDF
ncbi:putative peptide synthetase [Naviculisporaceae sp. PSN 640]